MQAAASAPAKKKVKAKAKAAAAAASAAFYISSQAAARSRADVLRSDEYTRAGTADGIEDVETSLRLSPRAGNGRSKAWGAVAAAAAGPSPAESSPGAGPASSSPPRGSSSPAPDLEAGVLNTPGAAAMLSMEEGFETVPAEQVAEQVAASQQHHLDHLLNADPAPEEAPPVPQPPKTAHMKPIAPPKTAASGRGGGAAAAAAAPLVVYVDPMPAASDGSSDLLLSLGKSLSRSKGISAAAAQLPLSAGNLYLLLGMNNECLTESTNLPQRLFPFCDASVGRSRYVKVAALEEAERKGKENQQVGMPTRQARSKKKEERDGALQLGGAGTAAAATAGESLSHVCPSSANPFLMGARGGLAPPAYHSAC